MVRVVEATHGMDSMEPQSLEGILPIVVSKVFLCQAGMCQEKYTDKEE